MKRVEKWEIYKALVWRVAKDAKKLFLSTAAQEEDSKKRKVSLVVLKPLLVVKNLIFYFHFFESFPKNINSSNFRKPQPKVSRIEQIQ